MAFTGDTLWTDPAPMPLMETVRVSWISTPDATISGAAAGAARFRGRRRRGGPQLPEEAGAGFGVTSPRDRRGVSRGEWIMQLGALLPLGDIGGGADTVRDFAQAAEDFGYDFLEAPDHVLGVNAASRPWRAPRRTTANDLFHDPFVLFGFLAGCTRKIGFADRRPDPGAAPDGAGRQAGGLPRRAVRRPVPARHRGRLERGRVRRAQREFPQPRPALGGAGAGDAGAVGRAARHLQRRIPHDRGCRHQPAPGVGPRADLVRRPPRAHAASASPTRATAGCRCAYPPDEARSRPSTSCAG